MSAEHVPPPARRWKWWQIALAGFFGVGVIGNLVDPPEAKAPRAKAAAFRELPGLNNFVMIVDPTSDPAGWRAAAKEKCGALQICAVFAWTDPSEAARAFPLTDRELETEAFSYSLNRNTGFDRALWDCRRFKRPDTGECLAIPE